MKVTQCDECGKVIEKTGRLTAEVETPTVIVNAAMKGETADYCEACSSRMFAQAGMELWSQYKRRRKANDSTEAS